MSDGVGKSRSTAPVVRRSLAFYRTPAGPAYPGDAGFLRIGSFLREIPTPLRPGCHYRIMKATWTLAWIWLAGLLWPAAVAHSAPYTLAAPIVITGSEAGNPGVIGKVEPVTLGIALSGALGLQEGNTAFAATDVVVLQLVLAPGSASEPSP